MWLWFWQGLTSSTCYHNLHETTTVSMFQAISGSSNTIWSFVFLGLGVKMSSSGEKSDVSPSIVHFLKFAHMSANVPSLNSHELNYISIHDLLELGDMVSKTKNTVKLGIKMSIPKLTHNF